MRKTYFILMAFLLTLGNVCAENVLSVEDVTIPSGSCAMIEIKCEFDSYFKGYQLDIELDDGISLVLDDYGKPIGENGFNTDHVVSSSKLSDNKYRFVVVSFSGQLLPLSGTALKVYATAEDGINVGDSFSGKISAIEFTTKETKPYHFDDIDFRITLGEAVDTRIILDEKSDRLPTDATDVNVTVKRTIKAGIWSTIVLPFDMTTQQLTSAFGDDVELANFTTWETTDYDDNDNPKAITVFFKEANEIKANTPYIIKVSSEISEFNVDEVNIVVEEDPCVTVGKRPQHTFGSFNGSYTPLTIDEQYLFLNDNKFWYSVGKTRMNGYRGYFYFQDILSSYNSQGTAYVRMKIIQDDGNVTHITSLDADLTSTSKAYNLGGIRVPISNKGIVIMNGKKQLVY